MLTEEQIDNIQEAAYLSNQPSAQSMPTYRLRSSSACTKSAEAPNA